MARSESSEYHQMLNRKHNKRRRDSSSKYHKRRSNVRRDRDHSRNRHRDRDRAEHRNKERSNSSYYRKRKVKSSGKKRSYHRHRNDRKYDRDDYRGGTRGHQHHHHHNNQHRQVYQKQHHHKKYHRKFHSVSKSGSVRSDRGDAGHYKFNVGTLLNDKYIIEKVLGDGTFGRVLECRSLEDNNLYAVKVIRPVFRYIESAKIEAEILTDIRLADIDEESRCVKMTEYFYFFDKKHKYIALVFEKLGKSLYEFIKENKYRGFPINLIQSFAKQIFEAMNFLHLRMKLTHTDLKPENVLLQNNKFSVIKSKADWPKNVLHKERSSSASSHTRTSNDTTGDESSWYKIPEDDSIKIIDFGGATYATERHSDIINTRQYRAPEVILGCCEWDEKSDIWSIVCILIELYTGELFLPTHDNQEHLCLIEKICGPYPYWMAEKSTKEFKKLFNLETVEEKDKEILKVPVNYENLHRREDVEKAVRHLYNLDEHKDFKEFCEYLLKIDPKERPSCKDALSHNFFKVDFTN